MVVLFPVMDFAWFAILAHGAYQAEIGGLLNPTLQLAPAIGFYALYASGVLVFVVRPALAHGGWRRAALMAAFFGLVAYGTYDLTNQATLRGWPWTVSLADLACGSLETAVATLAARFALWHRRHA